VCAVKEAIAVNLRRIRTERGLSVQALARKSGIARATIIALEAATANPTLETLMTIAETLGVPSTVLLADDSPAQRLVRAGEDDELRENFGVVRSLDQIADVAVLGILEATLYEGAEFTRGARTDAPGTQAFLFVLSGRMQAGPAAAPVEVGPGDYLRFRLDQPYILRALDGNAQFFSGLCSRRTDDLMALLPRGRRTRRTGRRG